MFDTELKGIQFEVSAEADFHSL